MLLNRNRNLNQNLDQDHIIRIDQKEHLPIAEAAVAVAAEVVKVQVAEAVRVVAIVPTTTMITIIYAIQISMSSNYKSICNSQRNSNNFDGGGGIDWNYSFIFYLVRVS
jgi:hypothetical protein